MCCLLCLISLCLCLVHAGATTRAVCATAMGQKVTLAWLDLNLTCCELFRLRQRRKRWLPRHLLANLFLLDLSSCGLAAQTRVTARKIQTFFQRPAEAFCQERACASARPALFNLFSTLACWERKHLCMASISSQFII